MDKLRDGLTDEHNAGNKPFVAPVESKKFKKGCDNEKGDN